MAKRHVGSQMDRRATGDEGIHGSPSCRLIFDQSLSHPHPGVGKGRETQKYLINFNVPDRQPV